MLHIDQLRAEGRAKLDVADLLTDMLEGRVGPRPPLNSGESGISEGPAPNTTTDSTHDHLLSLARNAYEAWRGLYRIAMPTGLGDVAEGEWAGTDKAMEALAELLYPGFEIIGSGGSLKRPVAEDLAGMEWTGSRHTGYTATGKVLLAHHPYTEPVPKWLVKACGFEVVRLRDGTPVYCGRHRNSATHVPGPAVDEVDVPADRLTEQAEGVREPHAYLAQYVRGEPTGHCAIPLCGADSHDPVHNVPAFSPISACTGFVPMAGYGETRCKSCGRPKADHPVKVQP